MPVGASFRPLYLFHLEIRFAGAAIRADPGSGNIFPTRAGREPAVRVPQGFVIDIAADNALPFLHVAGLSGENGVEGYLRNYACLTRRGALEMDDPDAGLRP